MTQVETRKISTASGLTFTADVAGPAAGPLVLLLHGFPESRHSWRAALPVLAAAGYRCVAPDQRGYSAGARPDPADLANYAFDKLVNDALAIAAAAGYEGKRFHQVGHDWGGQVAWGVANAHPERLASLTVLSRPHPLSFRRALQDPNGQNVDEAAIADHVSVLGNRDAIEAALAWYRANKGLSGDFGPITVPTLYIWGDADATVGPDAAKGTGAFVTAPYSMEVLPGVGHFVMDNAPAQATELILAHLERHPV